MANLQRSSKSFRRQGSSGLVWDDKLLLENMSQNVDQRELRHCQSTVAGIGMIEHGGSNGSVPSIFARSFSMQAVNLRTLKAFGSRIVSKNGKPPTAMKPKMKNQG